MMKVALVLSSNIWFAPYVKIYTELLDRNNIRYDIISWNRDLSEEQTPFSYNESPRSGKLSKFYDYNRFAAFASRLIRKNKYDRIIIFGPVISIFLNFHLRGFKGRYIIDYRDLSIEQHFPFNRLFSSVLKRSSLNVVSSPGFIEYLPKGDYIISHNFDIDIVRKSLKSLCSKNNESEEIDVLTIGGIRDFSSNIDVVKALANRPGIKIRFVGKGPAAPLIQKYVDDSQINNVQMSGYYKKEEELDIISEATFLNIFYPKIKSHSSALSNRFYNALISKKPMIVTCNSVQGNFVEKYNLGLSIASCENLDLQLKSFLLHYDRMEFEKNCNRLLSQFVGDYEMFEKKVLSVIKD